MKPRIASAAAMSGRTARAMLELQKAVNETGLETSLLGLIEIRASQINGCAFCIDLHVKEARARGESEERIYELDAWREAPLYTPRERAALAWTEAVTLVADTRVPDAVYEEARSQFDERELVSLTFALVAINGWNRLNVSFRRTPGTGSTAEAVSGAAS
jgi:AhpD family alkylhydroperoxidase